MKKLSKEYEQRRQQLIVSLESAEDEVESAIERMNEIILEAREEVEAAIEAYNSLVRDAVELLDEAQQEVQNYADGKSEKWYEGSVGEKYQEWINEFTNVEAEELEVSLPESIEMPSVGLRADLEANWPGELTE